MATGRFRERNRGRNLVFLRSSEDSFMELKLGKYIASFVTKDRSKVITAKNVNKNTYDRYFTKLNVEVPSDTIKKLLNLSYTLSKEETQYYLEKTSLSKDPQFLELRKTKEEKNKR